MLLLALVQAQKEPTATAEVQGQTGRDGTETAKVRTRVIRVQYGAVCQCWLSCVKQVSPGMEQVSLFLILLIIFLIFFLLFCSFRSHIFLWRAPSFLDRRDSSFTLPAEALGGQV